MLLSELQQVVFVDKEVSVWPDAMSTPSESRPSTLSADSSWHSLSLLSFFSDLSQLLFPHAPAHIQMLKEKILAFYADKSF